VNHGFAKSMNTHLHMLEAYTRLYQVWPHPQLRDRLEGLLDVMMDRVVNRQTYHFNLFFDRNWKVQGDVISFGHDIEGSWLMLEAAETLRDAAKIASCHTLAVRMVDAVLREGVSPAHGVMNEAQNGGIIDPDVHWWPQAEGIVGCVNAYQVSGNPHYLEAAQALWQFAQRHLVNTAQGEWFRVADQSGVHDKSPWIVDPWKCPYHNARSCMEVTTRLQAVRQT